MKEDIVKRFKRYVKINSESGNEKKFANVLINELEDLGLEVIQDKLTKEHNSNTSNIIAKLINNENSETIMLCAHMDTVKPGINIEPIEKNGEIFSKGETVLGADDKAGISVIMDVINKIIKDKSVKKNIEIIFTVHEEAGLFGVKALNFNLINSKIGIVLDSSGKVGGIVTKAPYKDKIVAEVIGKSSHAGIAPENGINAIEVASEAIFKMKLSNVNEETTANIGTMKGGKATNIVPDSVNMTGEVRSFSEKKLDNQINHMKKCLDESINKHNAEGNIEVESLYSGYNISDDDSLVKEIIEAGKSIGIEMFTRSSKGGSDANIFNENGIKTINLVIGTKNAHSVDESIEIESLYMCRDILYEFLTK